MKSKVDLVDVFYKQVRDVNIINKSKEEKKEDKYHSDLINYSYPVNNNDSL